MKVENFQSFKREVQVENRTFLSQESKCFFAWLEKKSVEIMSTIPQGESLFRARVWPNGKTLDKPEDMKPVPEYSADGRANPYGINMLYLANDREIAVAEVRPNMDDQITVAEFSATRELKVADFTKERPSFSHHFKSYKNDDPEGYNDKELLLAISSEFSKPISVRDSRKEYLPTQVIAEFFKSLGFDGVAYQSQFTPEPNKSKDEKLFKNYTLFDLGSADPISFEVYKIKQQYLKLELCDGSKNY